MAVFKIELLAVLLCLSSLVLSQRVQRVPTISYVSEEQNREIGDQVDLECSVQHAQDNPVVWVKTAGKNSTERLVLSTNTALIVRDNRFSVRYHRPSGTYTFTVKNVQESDAGLYQCQILISKDNQISAEVELKVRDPKAEAEPVIETTTEVVHLKPNDRIEATLARIENTLARIEAIEGTAGDRNNLKMDARNVATLARIETTLVRIEATLVRIEANQIEAQKEH